MKRSWRNERLLAIIALAALLFAPPMILIFDRLGGEHVSWLPLYLFLVWLLVIVLVAWLMERRRDR